MDFLRDLIARQRDEVAARRKHRDKASLAEEARRQPACRGFARALAAQQTAFIAEMKKASPSAGVLRKDYDPVSLAASYQENGAACLSVLTNGLFQGEDGHLRQARAGTALPLLRKDFIVDSYQVYETRCLGADALLLIVACLTDEELIEFQSLGWELGMDVLVEVHSEAELRRALRADATLIGVNNRNLRSFSVDLETGARLLPLIHRTDAKQKPIAVAESGIRTAADLQHLARCGADAFLVGETFMRSPDPGRALGDLRRTA